MRATFVFLATVAAIASARRCGPRTSSATLAETSITISSTPSSTDIPAPTETPASTIIVDTSTSSVNTSTSSVETSSSSPGTSTSSAAPAPTPTVLGFCLKAVTPDVANFGYRVTFASPMSNLIIADSSSQIPTSLAYFDIDISTGAVTLNGTAYAGYQVYLPPPFDNQNTRVLRVTTAPANPLTCFNPDGQYTSGSILKCSGTGDWSSGPKTYDAFIWGTTTTSTAGAWQIKLNGYQWTIVTVYDVAMFFGDGCL